MEDNSSTDDEVNDSPLSPKLGGKKLKLNDGSSHDSVNGEGSGTNNDKDEVVDSGISADKSESTSSDDHLSASGPSNELVTVGTSDRVVQAILLNIRQSRRERNYRKRKTPDRDSDNNDSSRDSDDLSTDENVVPQSTGETGNSSERESDDMQQLMTTYSEGSPSASSSSSSSTSYTNYSFDSNDIVRFQSVDTSEDEGVWSRSNAVNEEEFTGTPPEVLLKQRPKHNYIILREIINREMGLTFPCGKTTQSDVMFEQKFYGSLHAVYRLKKLHHLNKHTGCVNSINFHPEGHLLASGSDDTNVVVWDWARNKALQTIKTGHKSNVFQSKFLYLNARSQLNIVTCARDGQVRLVQCSPCGGGGPGGAGVSRRRLAAHARAAHKLHVCARAPHEVLSAGEDGLVVLSDVRADRATRLVHVKEHGATVPLYSVAGHPRAAQLLLAGRDRFLRVYDRRHALRPLAMYCPNFLQVDLFQDNSNKKRLLPAMMHLTCAVYNHDGTQLLGSYNDDDIYLFDAKRDVHDKDNTREDIAGYERRYSGHLNSATFKGVAFFGPRSQYVVSGSDCAHVYVWQTESEALVQWLKADNSGVVNCIEAHPRFPVLATSGLDKDVKIWIPKSQTDPEYEGMEKVIRENSMRQRSPLFNDFLPTLFSAWRGENRLFSDEDAPAFGGNIEFDGNACTAF
ncbi:DDB1- and CUL4-associated factor 8 isoform X2 [Battus philenor]|uniref:DDB1- and CUL4-associated factor 8 isoform X2 n=1 Tax=Battus philenor TaxID=42288 RepID=UPI0035CF3EC5